MPPTFDASILKTLAITSSFSSLITSKRTLIGQILAKFSYPQLNQALLAGYLLYNLSEVEKRFGQGKFIKFLAIQFLITRINFHNFLQIQHLDWLIFSLIPIHYNLNWLPRQNIFNLLVVLGKFFSGNLNQNITLVWLIFSGLISERLAIILTENSKNNTIFKIINNLVSKIEQISFKVTAILPNFFNSFLNEVNQKPEFPFLATASWRRQEQMEKIEQAAMQRGNFGLGPGMNFAQNIRQRQAAAGQTRGAGNAGPAARENTFQIDQNKLETLKSMGFREDRCRFFLRQTNNDLEQSTNFLLAEA